MWERAAGVPFGSLSALSPQQHTALGGEHSALACAEGSPRPVVGIQKAKLPRQAPNTKPLFPLTPQTCSW